MLKHKNILGSVAIAGLLASGVAWANPPVDRAGDQTQHQTTTGDPAAATYDRGTTGAETRQTIGATDSRSTANLRAASDSEVQTSLGETVSNDMKLVDATGEEIGKVKNVLVDDTERAAAVVVEVEDDTNATAGQNDRSLVVHLDQARVDSEGERIVVSMTSDQIRRLPEWNGTNQ